MQRAEFIVVGGIAGDPDRAHQNSARAMKKNAASGGDHAADSNRRHRSDERRPLAEE